MKEKRFTPLALMITAVLTLVLTLAAVALTAWLRLGPGGLAVLESVELIQDRFPGEYDQDQLAGEAVRAMVDSLGDRWSGYLTAEEYDAMKRRRENAYVGVGLTYRANETGTAMLILSLTPGGPAQRAGILEGEQITAIGGQALTEENFDDLVGAIPEEPGKVITFTVVNAQGDSREVEVTTAKVESSPVESELLDSGVGYVRLTNFYTHSAQTTREAVDALVDQGAKALLFDVRSNPGGYVSELTELLDYLLPEGPIFAEHSKNGPVEVVESDGDCVDLPMAVLINADSYSAAELFAAQLRESVDAPLIGEQTCGKGYYQQTFALLNGGALNLSTGVYTTGGGVSLIGVGLTPDVTETDWTVQRQRGEEILTEKLG